jgi:hypothetical protein
MKTQLRSLLVLSAFALLAGCAGGGDGGLDPGPVEDSDGDVDDDEELPAIHLFSEEFWPTGGRFGPATIPPFDIPGNGEPQPVGELVWSSNPANGSSLPWGMDEIKFMGYARHKLSLPQIDAIVGTAGSRPNKEGDLTVFPSFAMFTPEDEDYLFFQINTQEDFEPLGRSVPGRTQVIGIAFRNGTGGYVPVEPFTQDTFAGALVWMKATRDPLYQGWDMDQREWKYAPGSVYPTSLRLLIRGNAAVAIIKESELDELGVTEFRWDTFSYTPDVNTEWSHDSTEWVAIP